MAISVKLFIISFRFYPKAVLKRILPLSRYVQFTSKVVNFRQKFLRKFHYLYTYYNECAFTSSLSTIYMNEFGGSKELHQWQQQQLGEINIKISEVQKFFRERIQFFASIPKFPSCMRRLRTLQKKPHSQVCFSLFKFAMLRLFGLYIFIFMSIMDFCRKW